MAIEQIYCTHCTYGTSALEQREGELADRVLGYSARAGSLDRNELRNDYRAIERFLYYYLPSDTPPEDKQRLDAAAAPRRLFFCPAMGKLQMVGQVAYRQYDTAGRLGSYFAHVLFGDHAQGNWSAADCLRLWHAPWVEEDTTEHPYKLPSLETLDQLWAGKTPLVHDDAVLDFLQTVGQASSPSTPDGLGRPPHGLVDARWQTAPQQQCIDLLVNTLQGLLNLGPQRRENILLVIEPGLAALVFYGVARLLPKSLSAGLSFSTYEPNAERLPVTLAATTFFDPYTNDVRPDLYRRRGLVINTFQDRISESGAPGGDYARFIVDRLLEEGWSTVDRLISAFGEAGARRPEDVELLARTHRVSMQVLSASPPDDDGWRKSEVAVRYLQREVQHQLVNAQAGWPQWHKVVGSPNHLTVLELVAGDGMPAELQFLLNNFPPERIAELVNSPWISRAAKAEALLAYVNTHGRLPDDCRLLATDGPWPRARGTDEGVVSDVLVKLPEQELKRLGDSMDDDRRMAYFAALLETGAKQPAASTAIKNVILVMIAAINDTAFVGVLTKHRKEIKAICPPPERVLAKRLGRLLYDLPKHAKSFEKWLSFLSEWQEWFHYPNLAERRLNAWNKFRSCLLSLREPDGTSGTSKLERVKQRLRAAPRADYKPLAEALAHAMPRRTPELDELANVADSAGLDMPQFKRRLELAARRLGVTLASDDTAAAPPGDDLSDGGGDEVSRLQRRREQQPQMQQMVREVEERVLVYGDDGFGTHKLAVLQQIGQWLVGRPNFLGDGRRMIEAYFSNNGAWPSVIASPAGKTKHGFKYHRRRRNRMPIAIKVVGVLAAALLVPLAGYYAYDAFRGKGSTVSVAGTAVKNDERPPQEAKPPVKDNRSAAVKAKPPKADKPAAAKSEPPAASVVTKPKDEASASSSEEAEPRPSSDAPQPAKMPDHKPPLPDASSSAAPNDTPARSVSEEPSSSKPSDGNGAVLRPAQKPQVPATQADTDADDSADDSVVRVVSQCRSLPPQTKFSSIPLKISPAAWPSQADQIKLALIGRDSANDWLRSRADGKLIAQREGADVVVSIAPNRDIDEGQTQLAKFTIGERDVMFQWVAPSGGKAPLSAYYDALRRCVLSVGDGSSSVLIALNEPMTTGELPFKAGSLVFQEHQIAHAPPAEVADDDLRLGFGAVEIEASTHVVFGDTESATIRAPLLQLPTQYRKSGAQLVLVKSTPGQSSEWTIRVIGADEPLQKQAKLGARMSLENLKTNLRLLESNDSGQIDAGVKAISHDLNIKDPPAPPEIPKGMAAYRDAVNQRIKARAEKRMVQLTQLDKLRAHTFKLSAIIYRVVAPNVFARRIIIGDPQPPVKPVDFDNADDAFGYSRAASGDTDGKDTPRSKPEK